MYPEIQPFKHFLLPVSDVHQIYVEQCGNPDGRPVLFVHGGPGGGCTKDSRRFFNPEKYHIILVDQRGCGRSKPVGEMHDNNTQALIADFEKLREHLGLAQWLIFGGSWGSTLSLAYAQSHSKRVSGLILRGIYLGSNAETAWMFGQHGVKRIYPDLWQRFFDHIPKTEQKDILKAYHKRLLSKDPKIRQAAANEWCRLEISLASLPPDPALLDLFIDTQRGYTLALTECHYFVNQLFLKPNQLLDNLDKIRQIPAAIVHGRYDMVCPFETTWLLKQAWPEAELHIIDIASHNASEPGIAKKLVELTDRF